MYILNTFLCLINSLRHDILISELICAHLNTLSATIIERRTINMEMNFLTEYRDVLSPNDLMEILQTGRNTVYNYLSTGNIRSIKVGNKYRVPKIYLLQFMYPDMKFSSDEE